VLPSGAASQLDPSRPPAPWRPIRAHLLRWRARPAAQRRATTPCVLPSGAASHLRRFKPAEFSATG
jgi:hypothetical protein